jgi:hypothetical protein
MYKISPLRPAVVTGKTLRLRVQLRGRKIIRRPNPLTGAISRGILPSKYRSVKGY